MRTGTTMASDLSAIRPAPSYTFIRLPVTVMRPSGKMTSVSPSRTALMIVRVAIGLSGSSARVRVILRNGLIHQFAAMATSMAKIGSFGSSDIATGGSRKLTWLSAMMAFGPALSMFSSPFTSSRKKARSTIEVKSRSQLAGMVRPMTMATPNVASPMRMNSAGVETWNACSTAMTMVPPTMKAALSTLTPAMTRARRSAPAQACTAAKVGTI